MCVYISVLLEMVRCRKLIKLDISIHRANCLTWMSLSGGGIYRINKIMDVHCYFETVVGVKYVLLEMHVAVFGVFMI